MNDQDLKSAQYAQIKKINVNLSDAAIGNRPTWPDV